MQYKMLLGIFLFCFFKKKIVFEYHFLENSYLSLRSNDMQRFSKNKKIAGNDLKK